MDNDKKQRNPNRNEVANLHFAAGAIDKMTEFWTIFSSFMHEP